MVRCWPTIDNSLVFSAPACPFQWLNGLAVPQAFSSPRTELHLPWRCRAAPSHRRHRNGAAGLGLEWWSHTWPLIGVDLFYFSGAWYTPSTTEVDAWLGILYSMVMVLFHRFAGLFLTCRQSASPEGAASSTQRLQCFSPKKVVLYYAMPHRRITTSHVPESLSPQISEVQHNYRVSKVQIEKHVQPMVVSLTYHWYHDISTWYPINGKNTRGFAGKVPLNHQFCF